MTPDLFAAAEEAWGSPLPDWIKSLALACSRSSQSKVAAQLDRSPAVVSTVLRKKYAGSYDRIEERVRGILMNGRVDCPGMGQLPTHECQDWREKAKTFVPTNRQRTDMFRACNRCPIFKKDSADE